MHRVTRNGIAAAFALTCALTCLPPRALAERPHAISVVSIPKDLVASMLAEKKQLVGAFGVTADISYFDEGHGLNCIAYPDSPATVYLGINMIRNAGAAQGVNVAIVMQGVLAHEWAHILQGAVRADGLGGTLARLQTPMKLIGGSQIEQQADYLAGWYLARHATFANASPQQVTAGMTTLMVHYSQWQDSPSHGLVKDRQAAVVAGFQAYATFKTIAGAFEASWKHVTGRMN